MEDVAPHCTLGPVLLQCGQDVVHLLSIPLPAQAFKAAVIQHQWVVYSHAVKQGRDRNQHPSNISLMEQNQRRMKKLRLPVLRLPGVALHIQQLIDDLRSLQFLSNQEKQRHHASHLKRNGNKCVFLPKKSTIKTGRGGGGFRLSLNLVVEESQSCDLEHKDVTMVGAAGLPRRHRLHRRWQNGPLKLQDAVAHVHFAHVAEVVRALVPVGRRDVARKWFKFKK